MSEVGDDIISGKRCSECGVMFEKEHGHPVQCTECYEEELEDGFVPEVPKAIEPEI